MAKREGRSEVFHDPFPTGRWVGPRSGNFDGKRFLNQALTMHGSFGDLMKWVTHREPGEWKRLDARPGPKPEERVSGGRVRATFVGHATVLVQMDGLNVLTDPLFGERSSPVSWAGPRRYRPAGIRFEDLPPIDLILVSHDHYDHLCASSIARLVKAHRPCVLSGLGNEALLRSLGANAGELDWWQSEEVSGLRATFVPAQHFSGRGVTDRDTTLWGGFVLEGPSGRVYFAGDTGMGPHFREIRERLGAPRLALLPIGAYRPRWFMSRVHVSPEEAVDAAVELGARTSIGIHFGTFRLADDGMDEPVRDLEAKLGSMGPSAPRFWALDPGEGRDVPAEDRSLADSRP